MSKQEQRPDENLQHQLEYLQKIEQIFYKILEISSDGFLIVDDKGYIIEMNQAYCTFLGVPREKIVGQYVLDVIKNSRLPEILLSGSLEVDVMHKLADGQSPTKEKYVAVTRAPVKLSQEVIAAVGQVKFSYDIIELADKLRQLDSELQYYKDELKRVIGSKYTFETIIGTSRRFSLVVEQAKKAAASDFSVLLLGETGTGKEVLANAIHYASCRRGKPFIRVNCAAIPAELLEAELFGYEEGSFSGAKKGGKRGKFELANGGTILLDEIGDMPLNMQAKMLRVLQEKEIERVGGEYPQPIDVRVIAATNQDIEALVKSKAFRSDLYYRLNVIQITLPALRERPDDISQFIDYFLNELNDRYGTSVDISPETKKLLCKYSWPGNIREVKNVVERAYSMLDGNTIINSHLPGNVLGTVKINDKANVPRTLDSLIEQVEREILLSVVKKHNYNYQEAADELGIHRSTLYKKIEKYGLEKLTKK